MAAASNGSRMPLPFHVLHKLPAGDTLYVRAKHAQLVEKNPEKAISLFRASLAVGERVESALKDVAVVLKQLNRPEDAILAISAFRSRCSESAQDSLDNLLIDLYKISGRLDDQITLLIRKVEAFKHKQSFNGKRTKTARSQGKKFQISVNQEIARLLGNLGWAYMQQLNYKDAEFAYRWALGYQVDSNKVTNLVVCLMKQGKVEEAIAMLTGAFLTINKEKANLDCQLNLYEQAEDLMDQAFALWRSNGCTDSSQKVRSAGAEDYFLPVGEETHQNCNRACNEAINATDAHTNASTTLSKGSETMLTCNCYEQWDCGSPIAHDGIYSQESHNCGSILVGNDDNGQFSMGYISSPQVAYPNDNGQFSMGYISSPQVAYPTMFEMHAERRLPVFRDITLLESATA